MTRVSEVDSQQNYNLGDKIFTLECPNEAVIGDDNETTKIRKVSRVELRISPETNCGRESITIPKKIKASGVKGKFYSP